MEHKLLQKVILIEVSKNAEFSQDLLEQYHTHLLCQNGNINFLFNEKKMSCSAGEFLFWFAESRVLNLSISKNFKGLALFVKKEFLNKNIPDQGWSINALLHSRVYPVKQLEKGDQQKIIANFNALNHRAIEENHRFYEEIVNLQMKIFILEMWHIFASEYERRKHTLQTGTLYERFMQMAQEFCIVEREVQYYSDKLNITPKYLNQICKINSGVTSSEWIQRYVKEHIILLLQNKSMNIAEIADQMNFSSRSFFTRYVKKLLDMTPKQYRERF